MKSGINLIGAFIVMFILCFIGFLVWFGFKVDKDFD
jgi:hypothetical protein